MLYSEQPTVLLARRYLNTMLLTNFENLNSISNIFQETHNFLVLTDPLIICIYLRTTDIHFRDPGNVRHPTSKFLKCDLLHTLNTFRNPSLRIFAARKGSLVALLFGCSIARVPTTKLAIYMSDRYELFAKDNISSFEDLLEGISHLLFIRVTSNHQL